MRKIILSLSVLFLFGLSAQAQTDFIVRAGLHSVMSPDAKVNSNTVKGGKVGWNLGADLRFGNFLYLQPGVHFFSSSLSQEAGNSSIGDFKNSVRMQSLKIPVVLGLSPFNLNKSDFAIVFFAGAVPTFNLGLKDSEGFIKNDDIRDVNWNGKAGAGIEIGAFVLSLDYEFGLSRLFKDANEKFSVIGATVGFKL